MLDRVILAFASIALYSTFLWWFFFSKKARAGALIGAGGIQELEITVRGGYSPNILVIKKGSPVRLNFKREETADCSERVIFSDFNVSKKLPAHQTTAVEFLPDKSGEFTFTCGMGMYQGKLIVEER